MVNQHLSFMILMVSPLDLTELILREQSMSVNREEFDQQMGMQKSRSRNDAVVETDDWMVVSTVETTEFVGYDTTEADVKIVRLQKGYNQRKNTISFGV